MTHNDPIRIAAALSTSEDTAAAAREVCQQALATLEARPNLALVFASIDHAPQFDQLAAILREQLGDACLLGCTGESIAGGQREIEGASALALWVAHLPDVSLWPMHLQFQRTAEGGAIVGWNEQLPAAWPADAALIVLGEPYTFLGDLLLESLNHDQTGIVAVGGMASGGRGPGEHRLLLGDGVFDHGAVAVLVHGAVRVRTVVSQGCRPIGRPLVVTKAQDNVIQQLGGRPAFEQLQEIYQALSADEQQLARQGLHVGQVINEYQDHFGRGDFLVRNVQGVDSANGAIVIGDLVRVGQTVQFHVRDADTADEDLKALLATARQSVAGVCHGALLFTCNGRGTRLFERPHHDASTVARAFADLPLAGFFAQGEIGPIGGRNFLHGFTASIALFESV